MITQQGDSTLVYLNWQDGQLVPAVPDEAQVVKEIEPGGGVRFLFRKADQTKALTTSSLEDGGAIVPDGVAEPADHSTQRKGVAMAVLPRAAALVLDEWRTRWMDDLEAEDLRDVLEVEETLHVTVRYGFLASVAPEDAAPLITPYPPLNLLISGLMVFEGAEGGTRDVLVAHVDSGGQLEDMHARLGQLPNEATYSQYVPHCTLAYLAVGSGQRLLEAILDVPHVTTVVEGVEWRGADGAVSAIPLHGGIQPLRDQNDGWPDGTEQKDAKERQAGMKSVVKVIEERDGKYVVLTGDRSRVLGTHATRREAEAQLAAIEASKERADKAWEESAHPRVPAGSADGGQFTDGGGGDKPSYKVHTVEEAYARLTAGQRIILAKPRMVSTLLDKLADEAVKARVAGRSLVINLCDVSVEGSNIFCAENVGYSRVQMPQLSGKPLPGSPADALPKDSRGGVDIGHLFIDHLEKEKHIRVLEEPILSKYLKASQNELDGEKVAGMMRSIELGKIRPAPIFVSQDDYVVDGHHRWAAKLGRDLRSSLDLDAPMPISRIQAPILEVLVLANKFAERMGIPQAQMHKAA